MAETLGSLSHIKPLAGPATLALIRRWRDALKIYKLLGDKPLWVPTNTEMVEVFLEEWSHVREVNSDG